MLNTPSPWEIVFSLTLAYYLVGLISVYVIARTPYITKRMESWIPLFLPAAFFFALTPKLFRFCHTRIRKKIGDSVQECPSAAELFITQEVLSLWALLASVPLTAFSIWLNSPVLQFVMILTFLTATLFFTASKLGMQRLPRPKRRRRLNRTETVVLQEVTQPA